LVSRHSAFYSPLIAVISARFLEREGLRASYGMLQPGQRSYTLIRSGEADIIQSAVSSNWRPMESGERDLPLHFAQINCRDGFFLVTRQPSAAFSWRDLEGHQLLADHAFQPLAMLRYAVRRNGADWSRVQALDTGSPDQMQTAFLAGRGDFVHLQGPAAQQLAHDGLGQVVAAVGAAMPAVAFSSLTASRAFLQTDLAAAFLRVYRQARRWVRQTPAAEVATAEAAFFPGVPQAALAAAIAAYQQLGCWEGDLPISRDLYEQTLEVFLDSQAISRRWPYEDVVFVPPSLEPQARGYL
jgi:NitT/TauT family transport system substrate-binding protein